MNGTPGRMKILVIDDSLTIIKMIQTSLSDSGYEMITAMHGMEGIESAVRNKPDLILLDVIMHEIDGFEVCSKLKKTPAVKDIPVIFLTSLTDTDNIVKGFEAGAVDYIVKPFNKLELLARIKTQLELMQSRKTIKDQEQRLSFALDGSETGVWDWDLHAGIVSYSEKLLNMFDNTANLDGKSYFEMLSCIDDEYKKQFESTLKNLADGKIDEFYSEFSIINQAGQKKWILSRGKVIEKIDSKPIRVTGTHTDITRLKSDQAKIMVLSQAVEQSANLIFLTDTEGKIEYVNSSFTQTTGYTSDEIKGKNPAILKSGETSSDQYKKFWSTISSGNEWRGEFHNRKKDGNLYWVSASINPVLTEKGAITNYLAIQEDITEKKIHHDQLNYFATIDILTKALNRRTGLEILNKQISLSKRQGFTLVISFIDLNNLKFVNDTYGHNEGDRFITGVSDSIKSILREADTQCRLGGDEFLIIFPDCSLSDAVKVMHRLEEKFVSINSKNEYTFKLSISYGLAEYKPDSNLTMNELISSADAEMYKNKKKYKEQIT